MTGDNMTFAQMCTTQELIDELCARSDAILFYSVKDVPHDGEVECNDVIWYREDMRDDAGMWEMLDRAVSSAKEFCLDADWPEPGYEQGY